MSALWTPQQREWLQAMGHQVFALTSAQPAEAPVVENEVPAPARPAAPSVDRGQAPARPSRMSATQSGSDRLMQALLRAAGAHVDAAAVIALVPDTKQLRGNAAAKRALWPHLRALRRGRPV